MKKIGKILLIITIIALVLIILYNVITNLVVQLHSDGTERDLNNFKNTPAWDLAIAVNWQNTWAIQKIARDNPQLLNYQDAKYGTTLLLWAVGMEKYSAAEALLKCGADPNISTKTDGETPLLLASGYSWVDVFAKKDPKYVKLLLKYGADPNKGYAKMREHGFNETGETPLMESIGCGIEKTKALLEAGADINQKSKSGSTAAIKSLLWGGPNRTVEGMEYAYYIIVEKKAKVNEPYYRSEVTSTPYDNPNDVFYPVDILKSWTYPLDSEQYKVKMKIVDEFTRQGVDYRNAEIGKYDLEGIKRLYPDTWQEYIQKY